MDQVAGVLIGRAGFQAGVRRIERELGQQFTQVADSGAEGSGSLGPQRVVRQ